LEIGKISSLKEWSGVGPGCPGQWGSPHPWRGSENVWMWHLGTWFSRCGGVGVTVGPDDLRGLSQPDWFCDSQMGEQSPPHFCSGKYFADTSTE